MLFDFYESLVSGTAAPELGDHAILWGLEALLPVELLRAVGASRGVRRAR
jgi:hypothetical protein